MKRYRNFEESEIWQKAHKLVLDIYKLSSRFPKEETYALTSQIRRSVISIEANIAEAFGRFHYLDKAKFYYNSRGSIEETKSHLITCKDLGYAGAEDCSLIKVELELLGRELNLVINALKNKN